MKVESIIFDLDGVLIEAKDWHFEALNKALGLFGYSISRYDHLVTYDGLPTRKKLEMLTLEHGMSRSIHSFINELKQLYTVEQIFQKCKPIFHHEYALSKLKSDGYKLAVCSNAVRASVELMLQKSRLIKYFDFTLSNEDVERSKPDPEIYLKVMDKLKMRPQQCLVVEDNEYGVKAAVTSGAYVLRVSTVYEVNYDNIKRKLESIENGAVL